MILPALGNVILLSLSEITTGLSVMLLETKLFVCPRPEKHQSAYCLEKEEYPSRCSHFATLHRALTASCYCLGPTQHLVTANGAHPDFDICHWDPQSIHLLPVRSTQLPVGTQPLVAASEANTASYYCPGPIESIVYATGFHPASCNRQWGQCAPVTDTGVHQHPVAASGTHPPHLTPSGVTQPPVTATGAPLRLLLLPFQPTQSPQPR